MSSDEAFSRLLPCAVRVGWPDFVIPTRPPTAIEVKAFGSKPTTEQRAVREWLISFGWPYYTVYMDGDFIHHIVNERRPRQTIDPETFLQWVWPASPDPTRQARDRQDKEREVRNRVITFRADGHSIRGIAAETGVKRWKIEAILRAVDRQVGESG